MLGLVPEYHEFAGIPINTEHNHIFSCREAGHLFFPLIQCEKKVSYKQVPLFNCTRFFEVNMKCKKCTGKLEVQRSCRRVRLRCTLCNREYQIHEVAADLDRETEEVLERYTAIIYD